MVETPTEQKSLDERLVNFNETEMKIFVETKRLILREIIPSDIDGMFELDSDPEVHKYLGNKPVTENEQISKAINFIRQQYIDNGIGRFGSSNSSAT